MSARLPRPSRPPRRRTRRLLTTVLASALLLAPLGASQAQPDQSTVPGKTFAAYEYGWYPIAFVDHFDEALPRHWQPFGTDGAADVFTTRGMFAIDSGTSGSVGATLRGMPRDRGRWEIRLKADRRETAYTDYRAVAELVPAGKAAYGCGSRNIGFARFRPAVDSQVDSYVRTLPAHEFSAAETGLDLSNGYWHTYGVEVTPRRISWFVDGVVQATEKRSETLSGTALALRLQLQDVPGRRMNRSRLRVDTVRYFTLKSPNDKSVAAPAMTQGTYADAC